MQRVGMHEISPDWFKAINSPPGVTLEGVNWGKDSRNPICTLLQFVVDTALSGG
jgi:hypothetical protein